MFAGKRKNPARRPFGSGNPQCSVFGNSCRRGDGGMYRDVLLRLRFDDDEQFQQEATEVAEALTVINMWQLQTYELPCCPSCAGVEYVPPQRCNPRGGKKRRKRMRSNPSASHGGRGFLTDACLNDVTRTEYDNCQLMLDARGIYEEGRGTCFELACERAARLRCAGEDARVVIEQQQVAGKNMLGQYHAYVLVYEGGRPVREEDPSAELQGLREGECMCPDCDHGEPTRSNPPIPIGTQQYLRQHQNPSTGAIETAFMRGYDDAHRTGTPSPGTDILQNERLVEAYDAGFDAAAAGVHGGDGAHDGDPNPAMPMPGPRGDEELVRGYQDGLVGDYQPGDSRQPQIYEQGFATGRLAADKARRGEAA